jgi:hypothetical protein
MKRLLLSILLAGPLFTAAQKVDSIYVNLYTDSLKKGTYNYINIDGLMSNGRYLPLDTNQLVFSSSAGKFYGNSLLLDADCKEEKVKIKVQLKNTELVKQFEVYIKKKPDDERLPTAEELLRNMQQPKKKKNTN